MQLFLYTFACLVPSQGKICLNCIYRCVYITNIYQMCLDLNLPIFDYSKSYKNPFIFNWTAFDNNNSIHTLTKVSALFPFKEYHLQYENI